MPEADITGKILIHDSEGIHLLYASDITHCKSDHNYSFIYILNAKPLYISKTLKVIETMLHNDNFTRCHKTTLVNIQYISDFFILTRKITLLDGTRLEVSCRNVEDLVKLLKARTSLYL
jgi:two-component system LytT family response regulator